MGKNLVVQFYFIFRTNSTISLLRDILSHTQPLHPVFAIQFNLKFRTKVTISLFEVILSLLQPLHPVLDLQINLMFLKMVTNDCPYHKSLG